MHDEALLLIQEEKIDIQQFFMLLTKRTQAHSISVAKLSVMLLNWAKEADFFFEEAIQQDDLYKAAYYHDIGLAFIPKRLIDKDTDLTGAEYRVIQRHALYGANLLDRYRKEQPFIEEIDRGWRLATEVAASHHERWDGKGYPSKLRATAVHFAARIVAIADAFDAIIRGSVFCMSFPPAYGILELLENANKQFDPQLIEIIKIHYDELLNYEIERNDEVIIN